MKNALLKAVLLFSLTVLCTHAPAQIITTIAGIYDSNAYNGDTIAAAAVHLAGPDNVILDGAGNYYISDTYHDRIRKVDAAGVITTIAGTGTTMGGGFSGDGGPATAAQLNAPLGMVFDHAGNLYIADNYNNRIRKISTTGIITTIAGTDTAGYNGDNIPATAAQLNSPHFIAFDAAENLYICDYNNSRIRKIDGSGIITTIAGTGSTMGSPAEDSAATLASVHHPYGIAIDENGNIYFSDETANKVRRINPAGIVSTIAGNGHSNYNGDNIPATNAWLFNPCGIAVDNSGNVYFADGNNCRIRKIDNTGIITTIAGIGSSAYSGDGGPATAAAISAITGVTISTSGDMYIAGFSSDVIRLVTHAINSVPEINNEPVNIELYPNPNNGAFELLVKTGQDGPVDIFIADAMGRVIYRFRGMTNHAMTIKIPALPGLYLATVATTQGTSKKAIIVQ